MRSPTFSRCPALLAAGVALAFAALPATAQQDTRQSGPAPAAADAPKVKRSPASPHPNCRRDHMGKCVPSAATSKKSRRR